MRTLWTANARTSSRFCREKSLVLYFYHLKGILYSSHRESLLYSSYSISHPLNPSHPSNLLYPPLLCIDTDEWDLPSQQISTPTILSTNLPSPCPGRLPNPSPLPLPPLCVSLHHHLYSPVAPAAKPVGPCTATPHAGRGEGKRGGAWLEIWRAGARGTASNPTSTPTSLLASFPCAGLELSRPSFPCTGVRRSCGR